MPQWRVYDQARALKVAARILKSNAESWQVYAEEWQGGQWKSVKRLGEARRQALAFCEAAGGIGAVTAKPPAQEDTFVEDSVWQ